MCGIHKIPKQVTNESIIINLYFLQVPVYKYIAYIYYNTIEICAYST